jgi:hypothetical protein
MLVQSATYHHTIFYVISAKAARANGQDLCGGGKGWTRQHERLSETGDRPHFHPEPAALLRLALADALRLMRFRDVQCV